MKRFFTVLFITIALFFTSSADDGSTAEINLLHQGHDDHIEHYAPADMPEAFYDSDLQEIVIEADGFASYYYVEIFQTGYTVPVIATQIDGYGDTIDVSSLSDGDYTIVITSEYNNVYYGYFAIE